jgi:hypothetical protein
MVLEPDEARICPTRAATTALEPDGGWINLAGQIYPTWGRICPTWPGCQASGIR